MLKDVETELREIVAANMLAETPLARSLLKVADGLGEQARGLAAVVERLERLEESAEAERPYSGGVHVLGRAEPIEDLQRELDYQRAALGPDRGC